MSDSSQVLPKARSTSDYAIDGLAAGVIAGVLMVVYLLGAGLTIGLSPTGVLSSFRVQDPNPPLVGVLLHLAISGVYGTVFGSVFRAFLGKSKQFAWGLLAGSLYGVFLYLLAKDAILPSINSPLLVFPATHLLAAHLLYGFVLGWLVYRRSLAG
jgi:hypothetical protein